MKVSKDQVLFFTDFKVEGGAKSAFFLLLEFFLKKGFKAHVWVLSRGVLNENDIKYFEDSQVKISYLPKFFQRENRFILGLRLQEIAQYLFFRFHRGNYFKVVASVQKPFDFLPAAWVWGEKLTYYQFGVPQGNPGSLGRLLLPIRKAYFKSLSARRFCYITGSEGSKHGMWKPFGLSEKQLPLEVLPLPGRFDAQSVSLSDSKTVFTLGHIEKWKGPEFWLKVAVTVCQKNGEIDFVWGGFGSMREVLEDQIPADLKDRIRFIGPVEDLESQLRNTAIYFQPSYSESQGLAVMEAMAFGLPCVVTRIGGLPDLVEEGVSGYIVDIDVETASERILELIENPEKRLKMGMVGNERYKKDFTYESWAKRLDQLVFGSKG